MGINAIIVSKDRACQLDALIRSIKKYAPGVFDLNIVYKSSNEFYERGYDTLRGHHTDIPLNMIPENGFKDTIISVVESSNSKCTALLTDDSILFDTFTFDDDSLFAFFEEHKCYSFSPRCGYNTRQQCHWQPIFQKEIEPAFEEGGVIMWDFTQHDYGTDYGRPVSLDGNINPRELLLQSMKDNEWDWCGGLDALPTGPFSPYMAAYTKSILTNIPVNSTHGDVADNWGKFHRFSFEELNNAYVNGQIIRIDEMDFSNIIGGHQEVRYVIR